MESLDYIEVVRVRFGTTGDELAETSDEERGTRSRGVVKPEGNSLDFPSSITRDKKQIRCDVVVGVAVVKSLPEACGCQRRPTCFSRPRDRFAVAVAAAALSLKPVCESEER